MAKSHQQAPAMLTLVGVAAWLNVSTKTVRRAIKAGALHAHQIGQLYRITEEDLRVYVAQRRK